MVSVMTIDDEGEVREPEDYEWGGDGSDLNRPVRAHVLAALVPNDQPYAPPLDQLLRIGEPDPAATAEIARLGISQEHVPDLVRMARDRALNTADGASDEVWAPTHALNELERLDVSDYAADLITLFDIDSEWFGEQLPEVLKNTPAALEPLGRYVQDPTRWVYGRAYASSTFSMLVKLHPELRDRAIQILSEALAKASENDPYVNADFITELVELKAVEALPAIRQAFEQDLVDESVMGGWGEVLKELGQAADPADPLVQRSEQRWEEKQAAFRASFGARPRQQFAPAQAEKRKQLVAKKKKNKRKQSAASRKANKRKRK